MTSVPIRFTKDPNAVLPYTLNWAKWLETGDTIAAAASTPETGITVDSEDFTDTTTTMVVSGGTAGTSYDVVVHVTTAAGYEDDRTVRFTVKERQMPAADVAPEVRVAVVTDVRGAAIPEECRTSIVSDTRTAVVV